MRALLVINALGEGGTESSTAELLPHLRQRGIDARVALLRSRGDEGVENQLREQGFQIQVLPGGFTDRIRSLRGMSGHMAPDLIHSALFEANLLCRLARHRSIPLLTSLVNTSYAPERVAASQIPRWKLRATQTLDAATGPLTSHFHAVSRAVADDAGQRLRIKPSRITVVHRGRHDLRASTPIGAGARLRAELGVPTTDRVVVTLARQEPQKDHLTLLNALDPLLEEHSDVQLIAAGREGTATPDIRTRFEAMRDRDRVHLLGHRADVGAVLDAGDVFVLTTRFEGLPGAIIEAMALGLPVVASDIPPVREVLGTVQQLPPAGDAPAFTRQLGRLLDSPREREQMGQASRQRFLAHFEISRSSEGMASLYRSVARMDT